MKSDRKYYSVGDVQNTSVAALEEFLETFLIDIKKLIPKGVEEIRINTNFGLTYIDYERPETAGELAKKKAVEEKKRKRELAELARLEKKLADAYFGLGIHMCVDFYTLGVLLYCRTHRFVQISVGARGYLSFDRDRKVLL